jgi:hypothetical protein
MYVNIYMTALSWMLHDRIGNSLYICMDANIHILKNIYNHMCIYVCEYIYDSSQVNATRPYR